MLPRSCALLLIAAFVSPLHTPTASGQAPAGQSGSQNATPPPQPVDQEQFVPYWTTETSWHSELQLRNNLSGQSLMVTPALRLADGAETALPSVTVNPQEVKAIDLDAAIGSSSSQLVGTYGSIVLRYRSVSAGNLYAALMVRNIGHSIAFHIDANGGLQNYEAASREGIWWLPNNTATGYLILTNQGNDPMQLALSLYDAGGKEYKQPVLLGPRETNRYSVRKLVQAGGLTGSYGGIKIYAPAHAGSLDTLHFVFDQMAGFSALLKMFDHDPNAALTERDFAQTSVWTLRAPMLALSHPDVALGMPIDVTLQPQLLIRNTTGKPLTAALRFSWRGDNTTGKAPGPSLQLLPYQTRRVDVAALQDGKTLPANARWTSVILTTNSKPDEVMAVATSYDAALQYGAQTPFSDQLTFGWEGGMWEYDAQHNSIISAGNGGTKLTQAAFTLFYNQGAERYDVEQTLQPDDQMWIDVGKLIREHVPDKNGKTLPADLTTGSYEFRDLTDKFIGSLFEGKVIYEKTYGHVTYGCGQCCAYDSPWLTYNPLAIAEGFTAPNGVAATDCNGTIRDVSSTFAGGWTTANPPIATVDTHGVHTGVTVGSTSTTTSGYLIQQGSLKCPIKLVTPTGIDNVVSAAIMQKTSGMVASDDAAKPNYQNAFGTINLGAILPPSAYGGCDLGYEMIGTIAPSIYTGQVIMHRWRIGNALFENSTSTGSNGGKDDTSFSPFRDDAPQSGGSAGKVYDLDAPGVAPLSVDGNTYRYRGNFYAYAALPDGRQVSTNYYFYVRLSCTKTSLGYQFVNDVAGDNQIRSGTTPLSWNLQ